MTRLWQDQALTSPQLAAQLMNLEKNIIFVGDGARLCYNKLNKTVSGLSVAPDALLHQKASSVGFIARQLAEQNQLVSPSELMPVYLRLPQAERELLEKQGGGKKE